jgi:hypothetical protein
MAYVLAAGLPGFACPNSVLPRGGLRSRSFVPLRRRKSWDRGLLHAKPSEPSTPPPARAWAGRNHPGGVGDPAAGCVPSVPPVGGWARLGASSWPQIRRWDRRRCCWRVSGPPGGPEIRWVLSVGWCPSKRVVVIHCARPYIAQKAPGGCVTAISGNRSCLRRMHSLSSLLFAGLSSACSGPCVVSRSIVGIAPPSHPHWPQRRHPLPQQPLYNYNPNPLVSFQSCDNITGCDHIRRAG